MLAFGGLDLVVNNAGLSISKPLLETTEKDWDLQHNVMAKGSFLVAKAAAKVMIDQDMGGDIIYISSKNSVFAGPNNIAYSATKADQAHQVRLLAAELGEYGIRVNGINPDGVVRGSGIFAGGWGAKRAAVYGVDEEKLGEYYAQRTLLKREVLPEHVANAAAVLTSNELSPHHRPAHPRGRRRGRSLPAVSTVPTASVDGGVFAAVDIGASSGRVILGRVTGAGGVARATLDAVHRFPNGVVQFDGGLRWDFDALFAEVLTGLAAAGTAAAERGESITSIGIDTWAVDYGLVNDGRETHRAAFSYRDDRSRAAVARVHGNWTRHGSTPPPGCSSCSSTRSTSSPPNRTWTGCRPC